MCRGIRKTPPTIIAQHVAIHWGSVFKRAQTYTHKQIQITIGIHIGSIHAGSAFKLEGGQNLVGLGEITPPIIEIQTVNQGAGAIRKFVTATTNIQVLVAIAIGIKKEGVHVFTTLVGF